MHHHDDLTDDMDHVARALKHGRPQLDALELDALKRRTLRLSRTTGTTNRKGTFMRSRTAITTMLASGVLLSGGGTALGVTALQDTRDAGVAQYGGITSQQASPPQVLGAAGAPDDDVAGSQPEESAPTESAPAGEALAESVPSPNPVQAPRQIATVSDGSLPFTGYAAMPVLLMGLALVAGGLLMRRRSAQL